MSDLESYYYDNQLRKYIVQFAAIFAGMQVEVGKHDDVEPHLIYVPVKNASTDRVVGAIKGENTQNKLLRLPLMAFHLSGIDQAPNMRKGTSTQRRQTFIPTGGLFPEDITVVQQRMPVPYHAIFELSIFASNQNQHYQILEQLLTLFDPILQIQVTDEMFDWTKIATVEMTDIRPEESIPMGTDRRIIQTTMSFQVGIHLQIPAIKHHRFIKDIFIRIGATSEDIDNSFAVIADLDSQGIEYEKVFSLDDVNLD